MDQTNTQPDQSASGHSDYDNPETQQNYDQSEEFGPNSASYDDQETPEGYDQSQDFGSGSAHYDYDSQGTQQNYDYQSENPASGSAHYDYNDQRIQQDYGQSEDFGSGSAYYDSPGTQYGYDQSKESAPDSTHYDDQGTQQSYDYQSEKSAPDSVHYNNPVAQQDYDQQDYDQQDYDQQNDDQQNDFAPVSSNSSSPNNDTYQRQNEDLAFENQDSQLIPHGFSDSRPVKAYPVNSSESLQVAGAPLDNSISWDQDSGNAIFQNESPRSPLFSNIKASTQDPSPKSSVPQSPLIPKSATSNHDPSSKFSANYRNDRLKKGNPSAIRRCIDQAHNEDIMDRKSFEKLKYLLIGVTFGHYSTQDPSDLVKCYEAVAAMFEQFAGLAMKRRTGRCFAYRCKIIKRLLISVVAGIRSGWESTTLWAYQYVLALAIGKLTLYGMETKDLLAAHFVALEAMFMQRGLGPFHDRAGFLWGIRKGELPGLDQFWVLASTYDPGCGCFVCDSTHRNVAFPDKEALLVIPGRAGQKPNITVAPFETWFDRDMRALEKLLDCVYRVINVKPSLNHLLHGWTHTEARLARKAPRDFPCANHKCLFCSNYPYVVSYSEKEKTGQGIDMGTHIPIRQGHPQFVSGYNTSSESAGQCSGSSPSQGQHQSTSSYTAHQPSAHSSRSRDTSKSSSRHQNEHSYSTHETARIQNYADCDRDKSASQKSTQHSSSSRRG